MEPVLPTSAPPAPLRRTRGGRKTRKRRRRRQGRGWKGSVRRQALCARERLEVVGLQLLTGLARRVPLERSQRFAAAWGPRVFDLGGRRTGFALENLRVAYPDLREEERRAIGRASYVHTALDFIDWARSLEWGPEEILARVEVHGIEHAQRVLERGRGGFALSLHMGSFELSVKAAPLLGLPVTAIGRHTGNPHVYERVVAERIRTGAEYVDRLHGARPILRALRANRLVAVLNDQYARDKRVLAPLFGARCYTGVGIATLALRVDAPVFTFHTWRDAPDHHQLVIGPPIETPRTGDRQKDILEATARYNEALEAIIRQHPEQWIWAHRRFRHSPDLPGLNY